MAKNRKKESTVTSFAPDQDEMLTYEARGHVSEAFLDSKEGKRQIREQKKFLAKQKRDLKRQNDGLKRRSTRKK